MAEEMKKRVAKKPTPAKKISTTEKPEKERVGEKPKKDKDTPGIDVGKGRKVWIYIGVFVLLAILGFGAWWLFIRDEGQGTQFNAFLQPGEDEAVEEPDMTYRVIDGQLPKNGDLNPTPFAVMVENMSVVRPQSGLSFAPVVYETLAEGGITRFMAVFTDEDVERIGPVRSARPYYLEWSSEYDAIYCHAGGSPEALAAIDGLGIDSLNSIGGEGRFFYRDNTKYAPHNLFTGSELLKLAVRDKKLEDKEVDYESWLFKDEVPLEDRPETGVEARLYFSTPTYESRYTYDRERNVFLRENGGSPHTDALTGEQIAVKNVIIQRVPEEESAGEKGRIFLDVTGEGEVTVLRDGQSIIGTWKKTDRESRTLFFDENGDEIALNRGNTWIHIIPEDKLVEVN